MQAPRQCRRAQQSTPPKTSASGHLLTATAVWSAPWSHCCPGGPAARSELMRNRLRQRLQVKERSGACTQQLSSIGDWMRALGKPNRSRRLCSAQRLATPTLTLTSKQECCHPCHLEECRCLKQLECCCKLSCQLYQLAPQLWPAVRRKRICLRVTSLVYIKN